ncbi:MAG: hypothetical protein M3Q10_11445 [Chloroflexota bacterium]|nr:hypothetical protein [Chloroflexota bacterium]
MFDVPAHMTCDALWQTPRDGQRYDVIDGVPALIVELLSPAPRGYHLRI